MDASPSIYANDGGAPFNMDVRRNMGLNARYEFVLLYTVGWDRIADISHVMRHRRAGELPGCERRG